MRIEAVDVSILINGRQVIRQESLACHPNTMTALVGPSGCGKTTLLHCLGLFQRPDSGQVMVDGVDTTRWSSAKRCRFWSDHVAFVLQDYGIMEAEPVAYNVTMSASLFRGRVRGDLERLQTALELTGLIGRDDEVAAHLSGGEKQRLAVARAIYKSARVLIVDEPTASLDEVNRARVIDLLVGRAREGCTVIVATHDDEMIDACDIRHAVGRVSDEAQVSQ